MQDPRWRPFIDRQPLASIFHSTGWLAALAATYGFRPAVITTSQPDALLRNGLLFCRVNSWLTGARLVSLPFSDYCEPIVSDPAELALLCQSYERLAKEEDCGYAELRPITVSPGASSRFAATQRFCRHHIDLRPGRNEVFSRFHKHCIQILLSR